MLKYIARRIVVGIPTLFAILGLSFLISRNVPGDPVSQEMDSQYRPGSFQGRSAYQKEYARLSHEKGLDKPLFYFSLTPLAYPDTLHRIVDLGEREVLSSLIAQYGNWEMVERYHEQLLRTHGDAFSMTVGVEDRENLLIVQRYLEELRQMKRTAEIDFHLHALDSMVAETPSLQPELLLPIKDLQAKFTAVKTSATTWRLYVPALHIYGFDNQFHTWIGRLARLDFGKSYGNKRPVADMIAEAAPWTIFMGFMSYMIAYMVAIPSGVFAVRRRNTWQDRTLTVGLFLLNSVPTFVMAMLAMTFLCNPQYLQLFPTTGVMSDGAERWPLLYRLLDQAHHLILPTLLFSYQSISFISRQLRGGMVDTIQMDFIRTARAKGLPEGRVIWHHALRNSLLPIITHLAGLLPSMVGGALITEFIFSIPGMGLLTLDALGSYDHPVIIGIFTISAVATLLGVLLTDILYAVVDPRISFASK